jgi:hypothetical protein
VFIASSVNSPTNASTSPAEAAPEIVTDSVSQDAMDEEDGLPLLTEVITGPLPVAASFTQAQLDAVHQELARWLAEELPEAVLKVTDGVADQLVKELTCQAEKQLLPCLLAHLAPHH